MTSTQQPRGWSSSHWWLNNAMQRRLVQTDPAAQAIILVGNNASAGPPIKPDPLSLTDHTAIKSYQPRPHTIIQSVPVYAKLNTKSQQLAQADKEVAAGGMGPRQASGATWTHGKYFQESGSRSTSRQGSRHNLASINEDDEQYRQMEEHFKRKYGLTSGSTAQVSAAPIPAPVVQQQPVPQARVAPVMPAVNQATNVRVTEIRTMGSPTIGNISAQSSYRRLQQNVGSTDSDDSLSGAQRGGIIGAVTGAAAAASLSAKQFVNQGVDTVKSATSTKQQSTTGEDDSTSSQTAVQSDNTYSNAHEKKSPSQPAIPSSRAQASGDIPAINDLSKYYAAEAVRARAAQRQQQDNVYRHENFAQQQQQPQQQQQYEQQPTSSGGDAQSSGSKTGLIAAMTGAAVAAGVGAKQLMSKGVDSVKSVTRKNRQSSATDDNATANNTESSPAGQQVITVPVISNYEAVPVESAKDNQTDAPVTPPFESSQQRQPDAAQMPAPQVTHYKYVAPQDEEETKEEQAEQNDAQPEQSGATIITTPISDDKTNVQLAVDRTVKPDLQRITSTSRNTPPPSLYAGRGTSTTSPAITPRAKSIEETSAVPTSSMAAWPAADHAHDHADADAEAQPEPEPAVEQTVDTSSQQTSQHEDVADDAGSQQAEDAQTDAGGADNDKAGPVSWIDRYRMIAADGKSALPAALLATTAVVVDGMTGMNRRKEEPEQQASTSTEHDDNQDTQPEEHGAESHAEQASDAAPVSHTVDDKMTKSAEQEQPQEQEAVGSEPAADDQVDAAETEESAEPRSKPLLTPLDRFLRTGEDAEVYTEQPSAGIACSRQRRRLQ